MSERCPTCTSPSPDRFPATGYEGEVAYFCPDVWHDSDPWHVARRSPFVQAEIDAARAAASSEGTPGETP